jgi:hypothetical protein
MLCGFDRWPLRWAHIALMLCVWIGSSACRSLDESTQTRNVLLQRSKVSIQTIALRKCADLTESEKKLVGERLPTLYGYYWIAAEHGQFIYFWEFPDDQRLRANYTGDIRQIDQDAVTFNRQYNGK